MQIIVGKLANYHTMSIFQNLFVFLTENNPKLAIGNTDDSVKAQGGCPTDDHYKLHANVQMELHIQEKLFVQEEQEFRDQEAHRVQEVLHVREKYEVRVQDMI